MAHNTHSERKRFPGAMENFESWGTFSVFTRANKWPSLWFIPFFLRDAYRLDNTTRKAACFVFPSSVLSPRNFFSKIASTTFKNPLNFHFSLSPSLSRSLSTHESQLRNERWFHDTIILSANSNVSCPDRFSHSPANKLEDLGFFTFSFLSQSLYK